MYTTGYLKTISIIAHSSATAQIIEPYLVEQERTGNAQLLRNGSKHLGQNFFFILLF
jgi:hypothetical protein